jgi:alpha-1,6-mannosyltransferase
VSSVPDARARELGPAAVLAPAAAAGVVAALAVLELGAAAGGSRFTPPGAAGAGLFPAPGPALQDALLPALGLLAVGYAITVAAAGGLGRRTAWTAVLAAHALVLAGPLLVSQDVFNYVAYARLGALHGLDPYVHGPAAAPHDPVFAWVGWQHVPSAYGPLFTLLSYAVAPLGVFGAVWALKVVAAVASLATVGLTGRCARRLGRSEAAAVAVVGLNPLWLVWALGGAHNDMLLVLGLTGAIALRLSGRPVGAGAAAVAAAAVKLTGAVALPFLMLGRDRVRTAAGAAAATVVVGAAALAAFGGDSLGFLGVLQGHADSTSPGSLPVEVARLTGARPGAGGQVLAIDAALVLGLVYVAWRAHRARDWLSGLAWALLLTAVVTPWCLPWYLTWPLPAAVLCRDRRALAAVLVVQALVIVQRMGPLM